MKGLVIVYRLRNKFSETQPFNYVVCELFYCRKHDDGLTIHFFIY